MIYHRLCFPLEALLLQVAIRLKYFLKNRFSVKNPLCIITAGEKLERKTLTGKKRCGSLFFFDLDYFLE